MFFLLVCFKEAQQPKIGKDMKNIGNMKIHISLQLMTKKVLGVQGNKSCIASRSRWFIDSTTSGRSFVLHFLLHSGGFTEAQNCSFWLSADKHSFEVLSPLFLEDCSTSKHRHCASILLSHSWNCELFLKLPHQSILFFFFAITCGHFWSRTNH